MSFFPDNPSEILATLDGELTSQRMPDVVELHDAFARALPVVRGILKRHSG